MSSQYPIYDLIDKNCKITKEERQNIEERVAARKMVTELVQMGEEVCQKWGDQAKEHFWSLMRDRGIMEVGLPPEAIEEITPMTDKRTEAFLKQKLPYGKYQGKTVKEVLREDARYLHWLSENPNDFQALLKQYLARDKYKGI